MFFVQHIKQKQKMKPLHDVNRPVEFLQSQTKSLVSSHYPHGNREESNSFYRYPCLHHVARQLKIPSKTKCTAQDWRLVLKAANRGECEACASMRALFGNTNHIDSEPAQVDLPPTTTTTGLVCLLPHSLYLSLLTVTQLVLAESRTSKLRIVTRLTSVFLLLVLLVHVVCCSSHILFKQVLNPALFPLCHFNNHHHHHN